MFIVKDPTKALEYLLHVRQSAEEWLRIAAERPFAVHYDGYSIDQVQEHFQTSIRLIDEALEGLVQPPQVVTETHSTDYRDDRKDNRSSGGTYARERQRSRNPRRADGD